MKWNPVDCIVFLLAFTVCFVLCFSLIRLLITGMNLTIDKAELLAGIISSFIAIISVYVGSKVNRNRTKKKGDE